MASLPWFELDIDFSEHPKVMALCARLKEPLADAYVARLWAYCYRQATDRLEGEAGPAIVEMAARWRGKPGVLASALLAVGILDQAGPDLIAHGVAERLGPHLEARKNAAVRQKRRRDKLAKEPAKGRDEPCDVTRDVPGDVAPASRLYRDRDKYRDQKQEAAAATRELARSDSDQLGSGAAEAATPPPAAEAAPEPGPSSPGTAEPAGAPERAPTSSPTPAAVGHSAEAATSTPPARPVRLAAPLVVDDDVRRPLTVTDLTELAEGGAELRARLERRAEWKFLVAAHERKAEVRAALEVVVEAIGVDRCEALCWSVMERRKRNGQPPPKAMAFFVPMLEEAAKGGDPMPPEPPAPEFDQVQNLYDAEVEARWAPLLARMNPAVREAYEADKARLLATVRGKGLWVSAEKAELREAEGWLFTKYSRRAAGEA